MTQIGIKSLLLMTRDIVPFFHELIKVFKEKNCKLFRLIKNKDGSKVKDMELKEMQNN